MKNQKILRTIVLNLICLSLGKAALASEVKPIQEFFPTQARYAGDGAYFDCIGDTSAQLRLLGPAGKRSEVLAVGNQIFSIFPVFTKSIPAVFAFDRAGNFGLKFDGEFLQIADDQRSHVLKCRYVFVNK